MKMDTVLLHKGNISGEIVNVWYRKGPINHVTLLFLIKSAFLSIYREKGSGTKTHWNRAKSLQKPHRRKNNRQRTSGRVFFIKNTFAFLN